MASFCTKCGAALSPDKQICTACGAPAAAGSAVGVSAQPALPPAPSGSSAVKIIVIVIAVFVGIGILGAGAFGFMVWRIARTVHVSGNGDQMTMSLPNGTVDVNAADTFSASDLGTDIYPGAQSAKGGMRMKMPTESVVAGVFLTSDPKEQVVDFYKNKLGDTASVMDFKDTAILKLDMGDHESVMVTISSKASQYEGKTRISITHTTKNKPS
ncbi:MAG: zinc ribbon domain-containing protein [Terracidiphilus sp.]|jgi:hypothetical protein